MKEITVKLTYPQARALSLLLENTTDCDLESKRLERTFSAAQLRIDRAAGFKTSAMRVADKCKRCNGSGRIECYRDASEDCPDCKGTGKVK